ncbi:MAG: diacylglycerol kinase [Rhodocyclaceae bacterium]|jgi:diacylglycerol kinase (ATP)|nr:diacylglycerol kinase [Rhodocyclaceae bacterium]
MNAPHPEPQDASAFKSRGGLMRIWRAFTYSLDGFKAALVHEAAFRQELALVLVLVPLALWLGDDILERVLLVGSLLQVLIVEILNSAVEAVVDRVSMDRHDLSKRAKDLGSAAVMLSLALAAWVWAGLLLF